MRLSPELSAPEEQAWTGLLRAHAALVRDVDTELRAAEGLPLSWCDVLQAVADAPGERIRMGHLAERVMMTRPGLTGLVDRLEQARLVERRTGTGDARVICVTLTPQGSAVLERARKTRRDAIRRRYTSLLNDSELGVMTRIWDRLDAGPPAACRP